MLRNKEIRKFASMFFLIAFGTILAAYNIHPAAGFLAAFSILLSGFLFFLFTRERYRKIAQISEEINQVLHDAEKVYIADCEE